MLNHQFPDVYTLLNSLGVALYIADMKTYEIIVINSFGRALWGDVEGKLCYTALQYKQDGPCPFCSNERLVDESGNPIGIIEWEYYQKECDTWYRYHDCAINWPDGRVVRMTVALDITQLKKTEIALEQSNEQYQLLNDVTLEGVCIHVEGVAIDMNASFARLLGYRRNELLGQNLLMCIHPEDKHYVALQMAKSHAPPYVVRMIKRSGEQFFAEIEARNFTKEGKVLRVAAVRDVTERKKTQEALVSSEENFRSLFLQMEQGVAIHEMIFDTQQNPIDYRFINANPSFERLTGLSRHQIMGKRVLEILPHTEPYWIEIYGEVVSSGNSVRFSDYSRELGKFYEVYAYRSKPGQFATVITDITEQKLLEQSLVDHKQLLDATGGGLISTDLSLHVVYINSVAEVLTGWSKKDAIGTSVHKVAHFFHEMSNKSFTSIPSEVLQHGERQLFDSHILLQHKDGSTIPVTMQCALLSDEQGSRVGVVYSFADCTEQRQREAHIEYLSYRDHLTGLFNRRYFDRMMKILDNEKFFPLSIIMLDINGLKLTNNAFGSQVGDRMLLHVANTLKQHLPEKDIVSRIGGDEFVVILPNCPKEESVSLVESFSKQFSEPFEHTHVCSVSIGLGVVDNQSDTTSILQAYMKAEEEMVKQKITEGASMRNHTIQVIIQTLYEKSSREEAHSKRVSALCGALAEHVGLTKQEINIIKTAGLLHDIGKIGIPEEILHKPQSLTQEEWLVMQEHPEIGYRILNSLEEFSEIALAVLQHHERLDGSGYPRSVDEKSIGIPARILSIADSYDAMTTERPYKRALSRQEAIEELRKWSSIQFDAGLVEIFIEKVLLKEDL